MKRIESRTNEQIKYAIKLRDRDFRQCERKFFFEGGLLLREYLQSGFVPEIVFVSDNVKKDFAQEALSCQNAVSVSAGVFEKLTTEKAPEGIFTIASIPQNSLNFSQNKGVIILDCLQDAGNVGTVIRTAAAFGLTVAISKSSVDIYSHRTARASMGALFFGDNGVFDDTKELISSLKRSGRRVFAAALSQNCINLSQAKLQKNDCFVIGNEGNGLSAETISCCDGIIKIDMAGNTESLNASIAASVLMWELFKRSLEDG